MLVWAKALSISSAKVITMGKRNDLPVDVPYDEPCLVRHTYRLSSSVDIMKLSLPDIKPIQYLSNFLVGFRFDLALGQR